MTSLKVNPNGAYVTSWKIGDREVLYQGSELKRTGIPLLFPNFDFGPPLPNHGFGRVTNWQIIESSPESCHLRLTENDITPEIRQIYPHQFVADLNISVKENQLDYFLAVKNLGDMDLPLAPGLHPYWPIKHDEKSLIKINNFPEFNPATTDWDKNPPNNNYRFSGFLEVFFPKYQLIIREVSEGLTNFRHLQIWSQDTNFPDSDFVCFEPVTRPQNGINTDPILVAPGETEKFHLIFEVTFR
jgi:galactose mutarotase-like enzyme